LGRLLPRQGERFLRGGSDLHLVPFPAERALQRPADGLLVVDHQNATHRVRASFEDSAPGTTGNSNRKQVPSGTRDQARVPPCASASWRAVAKPNPTPTGLPVTNGSNKRAATSGGGPGPESITSTNARPAPHPQRTSTLPPAEAASTALVRRLRRRWRNCSAS